ncbi:hypothetical protein SBDP1_840005 [Syntrophobacter sp. SbD1]|nr:hypothetical protein SBDP1_840005 [Syntrophobacter sp. SbD1]
MADYQVLEILENYSRLPKITGKEVIRVPLFVKCAKAIRLLLTLNTCLAIIKLFRLPNFIILKKHRPWIVFKYAGHYYLGRSFDSKCRGAIMINHYGFLYNHLPKDFVEKIITSKLVLWKMRQGDKLYTVTITFPYHDTEGDIGLTFNIDGCEISKASFTIIKGHMVGIDNDNVIMIARVQGSDGKFDLIRQATKELNEVAPHVILVIAIQAIASALNIESIAGITCKEHVDSDYIRFDYDEFWMSMGGDKINEQVFCVPTKPDNKPMAMVKANHRCRTKRKRQFKLDIYDQVTLAFKQKFLNL